MGEYLKLKTSKYIDKAKGYKFVSFQHNPKVSRTILEQSQAGNIKLSLMQKLNHYRVVIPDNITKKIEELDRLIAESSTTASARTKHFVGAISIIILLILIALLYNLITS
ncbi:MAG: hypothetical protein ACK4M7_00805 [Burkholderiales bacterium]